MVEPLDNGRPPFPGGIGDARMRSEASASETDKIVPVGQKPEGQRRTTSFLAAVIMCLAGGLLATTDFFMAAPTLVALGWYPLTEGRLLRDKLAGAVAAFAPLVVLSVLDGPLSVVSGIIACVAAVVVAEVACRGRLTPGVGCLIAAATIACHLAVDAALVASYGMTLTDYMHILIDAIIEEFAVALSVDVAGFAGMQAILYIMWPTFYTIMGAGEFACAVLGSTIARRQSTRTASPLLDGFDLPLWVIAVLVASAAGLAFAITVDTPISETALLISANLIMAVRLSVVVQGAAVALWFARTRSVNRVLAIVVGFVALYLEMQFYIVTIVGLVDVWANFRNLPRGSKSNNETTQDKK